MSNPVDVAKTRLMNQKAEEGKPLLLGRSDVRHGLLVDFVGVFRVLL